MEKGTGCGNPGGSTARNDQGGAPSGRHGRSLYNRIDAVTGGTKTGWEELALKLITTGEIIRSYDNIGRILLERKLLLSVIDKHADANRRHQS
jgi:hypothetical protein